MRSPEGHEKTEIKRYLNEGKPIVWYFCPYMAGFGKSGVPDIIGNHRYKGAFSIEVKREGKLPTPIQNRRMEEMALAGYQTFWGVAAKVIAEFEAWIST